MWSRVHLLFSAPCALTTRPSLHRSDLMLFALSFGFSGVSHSLFSEVGDPPSYCRFWDRAEGMQKLQDIWKLLWNGEGRFGQLEVSAGARQPCMFAWATAQRPCPLAILVGSLLLLMFLYIVLGTLCLQRVLQFFIGVLLNYPKCNGLLLIF